MTARSCSDSSAHWELLVQADIDGELTPADAARVGDHVAECSSCAAIQAELLALSGRLRQELPRHRAPAGFRDALRIRAGIGRRRRLPNPSSLASFGGGFALAAGLALAILPNGSETIADSVVADHIRALQPGHLMDVVSTDRHTVKPWFDGRLDFSPPVKDLRAQGFPLTGGRLDYLDGHPVAALTYGRRKHVIDLLVWPAAGKSADGGLAGSRRGYNYLRWTSAGMVFWAVSDLSAQELADFVRLWKSS